MKKVCILHGFTEGPWQTKGLRKLLHEASYQITKNVQKADIIIAHSGGCYTIPESVNAELIILVGLPHWPGRHVMSSLIKKVQTERKDWWWYKKTSFNAFYLFKTPRDWHKMRKDWKKNIVPSADDTTVVVAIRNEQDHFMHPDAAKKLAEEKGWQLKTFSSHHDDIWIRPEPYVELVKSLIITRKND